MTGGKTTDTGLSEILYRVSQIDGIDIELALDRISGKQNVLENCLEQIEYIIEEELKKMSSCLFDEDLRGFAIEAHGLKNAFASIGSVKLSSIASELEAAAVSRELPFCKVLFKQFVNLSKNLAAELRAVLPSDNGASKVKGDNKLFLQTINETIDLLNAFEMDDALECMGKLADFSFGSEVDESLKNIVKKIKSFKYEEAIMLLENIMDA